MNKFPLVFKIMTKYCFSVAFIALFLSLSSSNAQTTNEREQYLIKKANHKFVFYDYNKALPLYLELLKIDSNSFLYNYRAGVCYLKSNLETAKSVKYFEIARKNKAVNNGVTFDFYYYMGYAYHVTNRFDEAIECFNLSKTFPNFIDDSVIVKEIAQCELGKKLQQTPTDAKIFNLGSNVNSIYPDYSPLILDSELVFTSTRKGSIRGKEAEDGGYYEDIYISKAIPNSDSTSTSATNFNSKIIKKPLFAPAENLGITVNSKVNDASLATSPDGKKLFMFRKNKIYQSDVSNGKIGRPIKYKNAVFSKRDVSSSLFFTSDGSTLYFVSSRPGGYGGRDIYKSVRMADSTWGEAENLGPVVNTSLDEESPFFDSDSQTLYFSSQGFNSIGGFDVFKSKLQNDSWSAPENMGYPINSGTDDIFYSYISKGNVGYYTTMRKDGIGNYDIYMIKYLQPLKVSVLASYAGTLPPKNLKITVLDAEGKEYKKLELNPKGEVVYQSNKEYRILIPRYNNDNIIDTLYFRTPESLNRNSFMQEINYEAVKNYKGLVTGYKTTVYNVFFDLENVIVRSGARDTKVLLERFPMCKTINPALSFYGKKDLTKDEEYSKFIRLLKPDYKNFKIYSQTSYVDTSSFESIYKMQDSIARAFDSIKTAEAIKAAELLVASMKKSEQEAKELAEKAEEEKIKAKASELEPIYFEFSKSDFDPKYEKQIKEVANYLLENKDTYLEVLGYTDSAGTERYNSRLSEDRALFVKRKVVKQGVSPGRVKAIGMGEEKPVLPPNTVAKNSNSKRVEFVIIIRKKKGGHTTKFY